MVGMGFGFVLAYNFGVDITSYFLGFMVVLLLILIELGIQLWTD